MKNLILKWIGLTPSLIGEVIRISVRDELAKQREENINLVLNRLNNMYDVDGMASKLDDMEGSIQDLEYRGDNWDNIEDRLEEIDFDKVQELDDRLTELLAGYKLEVKLTQENY
tara:strand:- start:560 stop:901 length:342 start_codon:yes stop_codon:yes gene_type:complete